MKLLERLFLLSTLVLSVFAAYSCDPAVCKYYQSANARSTRILEGFWRATPLFVTLSFDGTINAASQAVVQPLLEYVNNDKNTWISIFL